MLQVNTKCIFGLILKMREILLVAVLSLLNFVGASSQITISPFQHPEANDSFYYKVDRLPEYVDISSSIAENTWDFSTLRSPFVNTIVFKKYNGEMMDLPLMVNADLVSLQNSKYEYIFNHDAAGMQTLGQVTDPIIDNQNVSYSTYNGQSNYLRSEYKLGDTGSYLFEKESIIESYEFTDELKKCLSNEVKRFKLHFQYNVDYQVDSYGTLILPSMQEEVLRETQITRVSAYYSFYENGDWYLINDNKVDLDSLFAYEPTSKSYIFLSQNSNLPLAIASVSLDDEIEEIKYQIDPDKERDKLPIEQRTITVYPNPTFGMTRFEFIGYPNANYTIEIISAIGKHIWSKSFFLENNEPIKMDFSFLEKGTYLYTIKDENGKNLSTKRLVIITP